MYSNRFRKVESSTEKQTPTAICPTCGKQFPVDMAACPADGARLVAKLLDPLIGKSLPRHYRITGKLGRGAMSIVYTGVYEPLNQPVAVKLLKSHLVDDQSTFARFQQEAKTAGALEHPNIVTVLDFGATEQGIPYLIMELLQGESLSQRLKKVGSLDLNTFFTIFMQAADALDYTHANGVVHRDVKPSNILLVPDESGIDSAKIVDFGIAKLNLGEGNALTATGEVVGTPLYVSPEQAMGKKMDWRADIYSLGCVMYESLAGEPAFNGPTPFDVIRMQIACEPKPLEQVRNDLELPSELVDCIARAMCKDPDARYQTMGDLLADLERARIAYVGNGRRTRTGIASRTQAGIPKRTATGIPKRSDIAIPKRTATGMPKRIGTGMDKSPTSSDSLKVVALDGNALQQRSNPMSSPNGLPVVSLASDAATPNPMSSKTPVNSMKAIAIKQPPVANVKIKLHWLLPAMALIAGGVFGAIILLFSHESQQLKPAVTPDKNIPVQSAFFNTPASQNMDEQALALNDKARQLYERDDFAGAEAAGKQALQILQDRHSSAAHLAITLTNLCDIELALGNVDEAKSDGENAVALLDNGPSAQDIDLANALESLAHAVANKDSGAALKMFERAVQLKTRALPAHSVELAKTLNSLGEVMEMNGDYDHAFEQFNQALAIRRTALGADSPDVATTLRCLGTVAFQQDKFDQAEDYFERASNVDKSALGDDSAAYASDCTCLGKLYEVEKKWDLAETNFRNALDISEKVYGHTNPRVAQRMKNLAHLVRLRHRTIEANTLERTAHEIESSGR